MNDLKRMSLREYTLMGLTLFRGGVQSLVVFSILLAVFCFSCGNKAPNEAKEAIKALDDCMSSN